MSLRWKLFRFLSVDTLLAPTPVDSSDYETSLFPSLSSSQSLGSVTEVQALLSRFASAADRAVHYHCVDSVYVFALPRGEVQIFHLSVLNLSRTTSSTPSEQINSGGFPSHLSFSAHRNAVVAVQLVRRDEGRSLPLLVSLGLDDSGGTLKLWSLNSSKRDGATPAQQSTAQSAVDKKKKKKHVSSVSVSASIINPSEDVYQLKRDTKAQSQSTEKLTLLSSSTLGRPGVGARRPATAVVVDDDEQLTDCVATYRLQGDVRPTSLAISSTPQSPYIAHVAVGFADGVIVLLSGDIANERATRLRVAPAPGEMIEPSPIIFLHYTNSLLYSVSQASIAVLIIPTATSPTPIGTHSTTYTSTRMSVRRTVLDNLGAKSAACCCVIPHTDELVVAKPEALFFFNRDGRGPCLAFATDGNRPLITAVAHYVIHSTGHGSITAYDVANKLIAYRGKGIVSCAFRPFDRSGRALLLVLADGAVLRLAEISFHDRVGMLLKRGLYLPAVKLARRDIEALKQDHVSSTGSTIHDSIVSDGNRAILIMALRQYAEYLMSKNRFDDAAEQLIETIGADVEPSWVISRLVEQPGLRSGLRLYLEALHAAGKAAFVHTKVLITCYRHDRARGVILGAKSPEKTTDEYIINVFSDVEWTEKQVDAAISLCRDAGLFRIAERVARRRHRHVQLAKTLIEDTNEPDKVLHLLKSLPHNEALPVIYECGRALLETCAEHFVEYLADVVFKSTGTPSETENNEQSKSQSQSRLDKFLPIFIDMPQWRAALLEHILVRPAGLSASEVSHAWILLFESLVCVDLADRLGRLGTLQQLKLNDEKGKLEKGDDEQDGCDFQESINKGDDQLVTERSRITGRSRRIGCRALKILKSRWSVIDLRSALEVAEQFGHEPCLEYLYEHLRMYRQLGVTLRVLGSRKALLRACRRHGEREPNLWLEALRLFTPIAALEKSQVIEKSKEAGQHQRDGITEEDERNKLVAGESNIDMDESTDNDSIKDDNKDDDNDDVVDNIDLSIIADGVTGVTRQASYAGGVNSRTSAIDVVNEAMQSLDQSGVLSSIEILEVTVESCEDAKWGIVREYFEKCCSSLRRDATNAEHSGAQLQAEAVELEMEIRQLRNETVVIKPRTCTSCEDTISLPAIHFYCGHSYHSSCLAPTTAISNDNGVGLSIKELDDHLAARPGRTDISLREESATEGVGKSAGWSEECPKCAPQLDVIVSLREAVKEKNERHDDFFATLTPSRDGFATVVEFLERSPFV